MSAPGGTFAMEGALDWGSRDKKKTEVGWRLTGGAGVGKRSAAQWENAGRLHLRRAGRQGGSDGLLLWDFWGPELGNRDAHSSAAEASFAPS